MSIHVRFYIFNFSLKGQEGEWKKHVKDNDCNELLLANCIAASAFLTYCGPFNMDTRKRMGEFFMQVCEHHGLPLAKKSLFRNQQLVEFLYKPVSVNQMKNVSRIYDITFEPRHVISNNVAF